MGKPGHTLIEIHTEFDLETCSVRRTLTSVGGEGLNSLASTLLGDIEFWDVNRDIMRDTMDLDDGVHKLKVAMVDDGHGNNEYRWGVV
jgi:hypothetical protein